ncbi:hypothetical protein D477_002166 [Arthrobacter crystallopoietes BAB-32]|uniref:Uncharacterized protein n=2 Tax=Crystallibacter crystallopoietes TaxID=37928 RepID=N1UZN6_9MICC|nr:hypothetical protein D477_002166 [Arthrobacter crystallopoietes BAB-32]
MLAMLSYAVREFLPSRLIHEIGSGLDLEAIVRSSLENAGGAKSKINQVFTEARKGMPLSRLEESQVDIVQDVIVQAADHFLLLIEVDKSTVAQRSMVKYALDQDTPDDDRRGTKRVTISQEIPDFGFAASQHVEIQVPPGLMIERLDLQELGDEGGRIRHESSDWGDGKRSIAHCALHPTHRLNRGRWIVTVVPAQQGLYGFAKVAVPTVAASSIGAFIARFMDAYLVRDPTDIFASPSASILLVGPALLLSWMSRKPEHAMVARLQFPLRLMLLALASCLLLLAGVSAIPLTPHAWNAAWVLVVILALGSSIHFTCFAADLSLRQVVRFKR